MSINVGKEAPATGGQTVGINKRIVGAVQVAAKDVGTHAWALLPLRHGCALMQQPRQPLPKQLVPKCHAGSTIICLQKTTRHQLSRTLVTFHFAMTSSFLEIILRQQLCLIALRCLQVLPGHQWRSSGNRGGHTS